MVLSRDSIINAPDLKRELVDVPEWGEGAQVMICELSALDRMKFNEAVKSEGNENRHFVGLALTFFLINEDGSRMFEESDAELLAGKKLDVLHRLFEVAKRLNGMGEAVEDEAKK